MKREGLRTTAPSGARPGEVLEDTGQEGLQNSPMGRGLRRILTWCPSPQGPSDRYEAHGVGHQGREGTGIFSQEEVCVFRPKTIIPPKAQAGSVIEPGPGHKTCCTWAQTCWKK